MDDQDAIRAHIRGRLTELGLSQRGASIAAGLGETTLRNYLDGMTRSFTVDSVNKLATILKVSPRYLLFGETAEVVDIWDRIPLDRKAQALTVLSTFADEKSRA